MRTTALLVGLVLSACAAPSADPEHITSGDPEFFASYVQPYLEVSCATLDCHGDPGRALRLYAELGLRKRSALRADPIAAHNEPTGITAGELDDNRLAFAALALARADGTPASHLALLKPLALSAGGVAHVGPTLWSSREAPGYLCLRAYLLDSTPGREPASACAEALDAQQSAVPSAP